MMKEMSLRKESSPEHPYPCPGCGKNLEERGAVVGWVELPERSVGHVAPGIGDGVDYVFDVVEGVPPMKLECANCGEDLKNLTVEDICIGIGCEFKEDSDKVE